MQETKFLHTAVKYLELIIVVSVLLYFGKPLLIPLFFGLLIAMVMCPVCRWFERKGCSRSAAVFICLLIVTLLITALVLLLVWQINLLKKDAPDIIEKITAFVHSMQQKTVADFGIEQVQTSWGERLTAGAAGMIGTVFSAAASTFFMLFMIPIYTALFLYHRNVFVQFLQSVVSAKYKHQLDDILNQTIHTYFNYIKGMVLVYVIVGILNSIGLLVLGVRHAILFGMLCAVMTIIPYLGLLISALLPISVVWMDTGNILYPIGVVVLFTFVQYLEANVIFPKVVGTQLNVSTFIILVAIIAGGIVWGVSGMVLFIPFAAILKIISDNVEELKPLNILLGRKQVTAL
jgi:predicted PurR-regulated permease PerM